MRGMLKRVLIIVIIMTFLTQTAGVVAEETKEATQEITFSDVKQGSWYFNDVMTLTRKGIITGVSTPVDGVSTFNPNGNVTVGEFLTVATKLVASDYIKEVSNAKHWATKYYQAAVSAGLITEQEFRADSLHSLITREDMAHILVKMANKNGENLTKLAGIENNIDDLSNISEDRLDSVLKSYSNGLLVGDEFNSFSPKGFLKRSELTSVICRLMMYTNRPLVEVKTQKNREQALKVLMSWLDMKSDKLVLDIGDDTYVNLRFLDYGVGIIATHTYNKRSLSMNGFSVYDTLTRAEWLSIGTFKYNDIEYECLDGYYTVIRRLTPITLDATNSNRPQAVENDIFLKPDGTKTVLKVGPSGILAENQLGIAHELGRIDSSGTPIENGNLGSDGEFLGNPYLVSKITGQGFYKIQWNQISDYYRKVVLPYDNVKEGQRYGNYFIYEGGMWIWLGP